MCKLVFDQVSGTWWVCVFENGVFTGEIEAGPFDSRSLADDYIADLDITSRLDALARTFADW